jgi:hypothetical protein
MIEIRVDGRLVLTTEELARRLERSPSAVRSLIMRRGIEPAGHVTKNVPVYYPEDLGLEQS